MNDFTEKQKKDLAFFKDNLNDYLADDLLKNKFVIISGEKIQGCFDTLEAAVVFAVEKFRIGEFIIQQIIDESKVINFVKAAIV